jgi:hypothetical protein
MEAEVNCVYVRLNLQTFYLTVTVERASLISYANLAVTSSCVVGCWKEELYTPGRSPLVYEEYHRQECKNFHEFDVSFTV